MFHFLFSKRWHCSVIFTNQLWISSKQGNFKAHCSNSIADMPIRGMELAGVEAMHDAKSNWCSIPTTYWGTSSICVLSCVSKSIFLSIHFVLLTWPKQDFFAVGFSQGVQYHQDWNTGHMHRVVPSTFFFASSSHWVNHLPGRTCGPSRQGGACLVGRFRPFGGRLLGPLWRGCNHDRLGSIAGHSHNRLTTSTHLRGVPLFSLSPWNSGSSGAPLL